MISFKYNSQNQNSKSQSKLTKIRINPFRHNLNMLISGKKNNPKMMIFMSKCYKKNGQKNNPKLKLTKKPKINNNNHNHLEFSIFYNSFLKLQIKQIYLKKNKKFIKKHVSKSKKSNKTIIGQAVRH